MFLMRHDIAYTSGQRMLEKVLALCAVRASVDAYLARTCLWWGNVRATGACVGWMKDVSRREKCRSEAKVDQETFD
jgi:hypothetical protein